MQQKTSSMAGMWGWVDRGGGALSVGCGLHCLLAPMLAMVAPAMGGEGLEMALAVTAVGVAGVASCAGWVRRRDPVPMACVALGAALMLARLLLLEEGSIAEPVVSVGAALCFVCAHARNLHASRRACCEGSASSM
ncbi:MAG: hypothetical protein SangKO_050450 [Sandaracinaceae bacterium]